MENFQWTISSKESINENAVRVQNLGYYKYNLDAESSELNDFWNSGTKSNFHQIIYIKNGTGDFESEKVSKQKVNKDTLLVICPNTWYKYKPDVDSSWEEYTIGFSGTYLKHLMEKELFTPEQQMYSIGFSSEIYLQFETMIGILKNKYSTHNSIMQFILIDMIRVFYSNLLINKSEISRKGKMIFDVKKYIQYHIRSKIDFKDLALKFNVSYSLLRKLFKEKTNMTLKQYHIMLKLYKAKDLIEKTDLSLSEISFQCGFENLQSFSKTFKAKMKVTPSSIKKNRID